MKRGWLIFGAAFGALLALGALGGYFQVWRITGWDEETKESFQPFMFGALVVCTVQLLGGVFLLCRAGLALRRSVPVVS